MDLSVLIGSCDAYKELWEPFQICFNRNWKHHTKNIIVTDTLEVPVTTDTPLLTVKETGSWGKRMKKGLDSIASDYVLFLLEDYLLTYTYTEEQLENYIYICKKHNIDRLQISPSGHQLYSNIEVDGVTKFSNNSQYLISMQPSIWKKSFLYEILFSEYSPWDFEIQGSNKLLTQGYNIFIDKKVPSVYFNAVRKGKQKSPGWEEFFQQQGIKEPF